MEDKWEYKESDFGHTIRVYWVPYYRWMAKPVHCTIKVQ